MLSVLLHRWSPGVTRAVQPMMLVLRQPKTTFSRHQHLMGKKGPASASLQRFFDRPDLTWGNRWKNQTYGVPTDLRSQTDRMSEKVGEKFGNFFDVKSENDMSFSFIF